MRAHVVVAVDFQPQAAASGIAGIVEAKAILVSDEVKISTASTIYRPCGAWVMIVVEGYTLVSVYSQPLAHPSWRSSSRRAPPPIQRA